VRDEISELRKLMGLSDGRIGQEKRKLPGRDRRSR
jgi:excinuclease ABC subunit B